MQLAEAGLRVIVFDPQSPDHPDVPKEFQDRVDALISFPPSDDAHADIHALQRSLSADWHQGVRRAVYLSSTSVYGSSGGEEVGADDPTDPDTDRGRTRLRHESQFVETCAQLGVQGVVLRLPGIYGPGRSGAGRVRSGSWRLADGGVKHSNRIHVDDIVAAAATILNAAEVAGPYIAVDDTPFRVVDLARFSAQALDAPMPQSVPLQELPVSIQGFWTGDRRLTNTKLRALGWAPEYASYREGLVQAWTEEGEDFTLPGPDSSEE
jgi:nucleoside-diphosphate-sugar epimerase